MFLRKSIWMLFPILIVYYKLYWSIIIGVNFSWNILDCERGIWNNRMFLKLKFSVFIMILRGEYFESWNSNCEEHCIVVFACKLLVSEFPLLYNVFVWNFSDNTVMPDPNSFVQLFTFCRQHLSSVAYLRSKMRKLKGRTLMKLNPLFHPLPQLILPRKQSLRLHYLK